MPSYNFKAQTFVVIATIGIHNFLWLARVINETFTRVEPDPDAIGAELPNEQDEIVAEMNAPGISRIEWDHL